MSRPILTVPTVPTVPAIPTAPAMPSEATMPTGTRALDSPVPITNPRHNITLSGRFKSPDRRLGASSTGLLKEDPEDRLPVTDVANAIPFHFLTPQREIRISDGRTGSFGRTRSNQCTPGASPVVRGLYRLRPIVFELSPTHVRLPESPPPVGNDSDESIRVIYRNGRRVLPDLSWVAPAGSDSGWNSGEDCSPSDSPYDSSFPGFRFAGVVSPGEYLDVESPVPTAQFAAMRLRTPVTPIRVYRGRPLVVDTANLTPSDGGRPASVVVSPFRVGIDGYSADAELTDVEGNARVAQRSNFGRWPKFYVNFEVATVSPTPIKKPSLGRPVLNKKPAHNQPVLDKDGQETKNTFAKAPEIESELDEDDRITDMMLTMGGLRYPPGPGPVAPQNPAHITDSLPTSSSMGCQKQATGLVAVPEYQAELDDDDRAAEAILTGVCPPVPSPEVPGHTVSAPSNASSSSMVNQNGVTAPEAFLAHPLPRGIRIGRHTIHSYASPSRGRTSVLSSLR